MVQRQCGEPCKARADNDLCPGLLFAAAMLSELLESRCRVMINHELLHTDKPTLFVISGIDLGFGTVFIVCRNISTHALTTKFISGDAFGCRVGDDLMVTSSVTAAIWHWVGLSPRTTTTPTTTDPLPRPRTATTTTS